MKPTLIILAAGIGSRFGQGIKQLEPIGPNGEIIMDYSIHDALKAGFGKIVFIIRKSIEKEFQEIVGSRIEKKAETAYVFQELDSLPEKFSLPEGRTKPWGTGHALLCCHGAVKEPFAVINADDYYGREAFQNIFHFLTTERLLAPAADGSHIFNGCMAGFILKNTLSDSGSVTRGICRVNENGYLRQVIETYDLKAATEGLATGTRNGSETVVSQESLVSMNMWGMPAEYLDTLKQGFQDFLSQDAADPLKSEYLLPDIIDGQIQGGQCTVKVLKTSDRWFGMTYREDVPAVRKAIRELTKAGIYPENLR